MMYLQPEEGQKWSRFSGYGCYCFQSFDNEFWRGEGLPKDEIDKYVFLKQNKIEKVYINKFRTCRDLSLCYHCLEQDGEQCSPDVEYNFIGLEDPETGDRRLTCRKFI